MKKILFPLVMLLAFNQAQAQINTASLPSTYSVPSGGTSTYICLIEYTYDASGNRVHREYACHSNSGGSAQRKANTNNTDVLESIVFPNPTTSVFKVKTNKTLANAYINVYTMQGMRVISYPYNGTEQSYNIGELSDGQYIIELETAKIKQVKKINKQSK
jgi:Secretion system C-terminal sorting domain